MLVSCPHCSQTFIVASRRSQSASNWFHKALTVFCRASGANFADTKLRLKFLYGHREHIGEFYEDADGEHFVFDANYVPVSDMPGANYRDGDDMWFLKSESAYDKEEEKALADGLIQYAVESGVDIEGTMR